MVNHYLTEKCDDTYYFYFCFVETEEVYCIIKRGEFLGSQKVVHIPGIPIGMTGLTPQDEENIRTGIKLKVDVIMVPGVRDAKLFNHVKNFVSKCILYVQLV